MKRFTTIALLALAALATVGTAAAQIHQVRAAIPFDFVAGSAYLPAGIYTITSEDLVIVEIQNGKHDAKLLRSAPADEVKSDSKLVFNRYGDQYFLSEILSSDSNMEVRLPVSKMEEKVRFQQANHVNDMAFVPLNR